MWLVWLDGMYVDIVTGTLTSLTLKALMQGLVPYPSLHSRSCKDYTRIGGDHKQKVVKRCGKKTNKVLEFLDDVV